MKHDHESQSGAGREKPSARLRVIGVGNPFRGDDGAGLAVARSLRGALAGVEVLEREGEPVGLIEILDGADAVWLVDAVSSGAPSGTVHRLEAAAGKLPRELFRASTHALGLAEAVELARALGRLPETLVVFGIEGARFEAGEGLSREVERAAGQVAAAVREEVERFTRGR